MPSSTDSPAPKAPDHSCDCGQSFATAAALVGYPCGCELTFTPYLSVPGAQLPQRPDRPEEG